jgi:hypothetical protein
MKNSTKSERISKSKVKMQIAKLQIKIQKAIVLPEASMSIVQLLKHEVLE